MTLNKELWIVGIPALGWALFGLGGTKISDTIEGNKLWRRLGLSLVIGLGIFFSGFSWWQAVGAAGLAAAVLIQGYGDKASWIKRAAIFAGYGLISVWIGISWWNLITAAGCLVLMVLSNLSGFSKTFVWKICEGFFGLLIGIQISFLLSGNGLIWG